MLTRFKSHAKALSEQLSEAEDHVLLLYGDNTDQENAEIERKLPQIPDDETVVLVATGQKIRGGFNFPRLDTLILAMPISRPRVVEQYVGRLNRDYPGKRNAVVYDYVDSHIRVFDHMYQKRLRTYKKIGYRIASGTDSLQKDYDYHVNAIYDSGNYMDAFKRDLLEAKESVVIGSPQLAEIKSLLLLRWHCLDKRAKRLCSWSGIRGNMYLSEQVSAVIESETGTMVKWGMNYVERRGRQKQKPRSGILAKYSFDAFACCRDCNWRRRNSFRCFAGCQAFLLA